MNRILITADGAAGHRAHFMSFRLERRPNQVEERGLERQHVRILVVRERAASVVICTFIPWSTRLTMCCACVSGCTLPPMLPKAINGAPSFITKPAMMVWNGRLRGATMLGLLGERERRTAVVQHEAARRHSGAAAVDAEHAVHERHHVAPPIRRRHVDRAALGAAGDARLRSGVEIDLAAQRRRGPSRSAAPPALSRISGRRSSPADRSQLRSTNRCQFIGSEGPRAVQEFPASARILRDVQHLSGALAGGGN